jgi:tetratricopeptide (TPR) repeat protein
MDPRRLHRGVRPVAVVLLAGALFTGGVATAQDTPADPPAAESAAEPTLDNLFADLQAADSFEEAQDLEREIWTEWFTYDGEDEDVRFVMMDGQDAAMRGMLEFAEERYSRAIELDPGYAEAWNRRATIRFYRGDHAGSIADIQEVLAREPRHFGALSGLGLNMLALGRLEEALEAFQAALDIHPFMPGAQAHVEALEEMLAGDPV